MQLYKRTPLKRVFFKPPKPITKRKMSFFPTSYLTTSQPSSFSPLFRFLDDFEQHQSSSPQGNNSRHSHRSMMRTFTPKFDVKEVADAYELHGELPGIEQKDVEIEFTDAQTLHIKGRTEKSYTRGAPPAGFVENGDAGEQAKLTEGGEHVKPQKATVEDEANENENTAVSTTEKKQEVANKPKESEPQAKYWVSERSIGEFSRTFTFPGRVDQDAVKASMKNGVLSIVVPKSRKAEGRKISIQ